MPHAKLYVNRMSVYVATWPQLLHCFQQEFLHRTSLESQKLSLMGEVSYLKLKLSDMEGKQGYGAERQHKAEVGLLTHGSVCNVLFRVRNKILMLQLKAWKEQIRCILEVSRSTFGLVKIFLKLGPRKFQANCSKKDGARPKNLAYISMDPTPNSAVEFLEHSKRLLEESVHPKPCSVFPQQVLREDSV